ncbi:hypothetical protein AX14_005525 [Amanita brunnescens Koide BX004]|nr:hypothetical protein AX14_005525 [Amanita brunnescens Koide BX004]
MPLQDVMLTNWRPRIHPLLNWVQNLTRLRGITIGFSFMWVINRLEISLNIVGTRFPTICLKRAVCCMDSPLPLTMSMSQEIWTVPTTSPNARLYIGYNQPQAGSPQAVQVVSSGAQWNITSGSPGTIQPTSSVANETVTLIVVSGNLMVQQGGTPTQWQLINAQQNPDGGAGISSNTYNIVSADGTQGWALNENQVVVVNPATTQSPLFRMEYSCNC